MNVYPAKPHALKTIFGRPKVLIGVIHARPLPGSSQYQGEPIEDICAAAIEDGISYQQGGFHGVIVENAGDIPFSKPEHLGFETAAAMAIMTHLIRRELGVPVGVNVLANGLTCALAVAKCADASFVRANQWANAYVANEGFVEGAAPIATRYRTWIHAERVLVFADVHVKHGSHSIVADRPVAEQARDVEFFDADVLIATGFRTGGEADPEEIMNIRNSTQLPVIVGSGVSLSNARRILTMTDGAIVGSSVKDGGCWWKPVSRDRVEELVAIAEEVWTEGTSGDSPNGP
ncbi:MAG: BtpA/SgcQ family protein [Candidatus Dormibacteria bacterium]